MNCLYCKSDQVELLQDHKNRKIDGNLWGVVRCRECKNIAFYIVKTKTKIEGNEPIATTKMTVLPKWGAENPLTGWLWDQMERSTKETGRPIESHYESIQVPA